MSNERRSDATSIADTLEHLTRALLDPASSQVERPRVAVVPAPTGEPADDPIPEQRSVEPVVPRPARGGDLLAELAFLDR
ncbi:hypothetical protein NOK12_12800 [Nocardioides sp. OK12]|uniref:hypothetical protein n=1 Tax=Nocardioides sp. OK12 TaxID=2758661 RepID=UPI0021C3CF7D|nr:hypothetical protein [Nocardioides sp. OK12]GHJ58762.1 hypothetical protein NOK12_12800 [Nocardioides sp. OK12]